MASVGRPWVLVQIRQPGRAKLGGRYTLVASEHPGSLSDPPIWSDQERVLQVALDVDLVALDVVLNIPLRMSERAFI